MHIKVDQSGKIEVLTVDTVLAFSNEITATLLIPVSAKRETYQALKSRGVKPKMIGIRMFVAGLFLLLRDHLAVIDTVTIDVEFEGWGGEIRGLLLSHIRQKAHYFPKECIIFRYVGKKDRCHTIALATYRGKRKPDKKVTGGELLRFC